MPTYVYECVECATRTEMVHRISDPPLQSCPECKSKVRKVLFPVGVVFKGPGFHVNDYAKSGGPSDKAETEATPSTPDSKKSDTNPASD